MTTTIKNTAIPLLYIITLFCSYCYGQNNNITLKFKIDKHDVHKMIFCAPLIEINDRVDMTTVIDSLFYNGDTLFVSYKQPTYCEYYVHHNGEMNYIKMGTPLLAITSSRFVQQLSVPIIPKFIHLDNQDYYFFFVEKKNRVYQLIDYHLVDSAKHAKKNLDLSDLDNIKMHDTVRIPNLQPTTTNGLYYYHPNHLGSTCYVTDENRSVVQGFLYAPFGEITNEYNNSFGSSIIPKYSFNAKELDEETGMYYYEARYYQPPVFTSRDRLFEKYPTISPYTYCANNPIKYIDPSGDSIVINGTIYQVGMKYDGKDVFTKKTIDALNNIYNNGGYEGAELVNTLCYSKNTFYIKQREGVVSEFIEKSTTAACARNIQTLISDWLIADQHGLTTGSGGDIMWNTNGYYIFTEKGLKNNPVYQLLHELCHAYDANFGIMNDGLFNGLELYEWSACLRANCIGSYMGYPMQTVYEGVADEYGEHIPGTGTKLFEENGDQINPF